MADKKKLFLIVFLILVVVIFIYYLFYIPLEERAENKVCFDSYCFDVEIVSTPESRTQGLMFREELGENEGMLFIFEQEGIYPFWMKNTLISLDMIWINSDKEIVFIKQNTTPESLESINPGKKAKYVLEVNGGKAEELGIDVGEMIEF
ncbi:MAG: DUF192 domain-containing protein [Candidatus Pacearchaeota archaeon]|nr:DUF192 domain-containing protein [Candidatus Pacearchaeota archaeon]